MSGPDRPGPNGTGGTDAVDSRLDGGTPPRSTDAEIAARIASAVHDPFRELWRRHEDEVWGSVHETLQEGMAAHGRALDELAPGSGGGEEEALARYRRRVADDVLGPLRHALRDGAAQALERSLADTAKRVASATETLPVLVQAPLSSTALRHGRGLGPWPAVKQLCARVLHPLVWRREAHDVPVALVARCHLARSVLPHQRRAFGAGQRLRAAWLMDLERAWAGWLAVVLAQSGGAGGDGLAAAHARSSACLEAGKALQKALRALQEPPFSGRSLGEALERCEETLKARVGVADTFVSAAADTAAGLRRDREIAARWDRRARESAARLELCLRLLEVERLMDGIRRKLVARWTAAVQGVDAKLNEIKARLDQGRERAGALGGEGMRLTAGLMQEQRRTIGALSEVEGALPDPARLLRTLSNAATEAVEGFERVAALMPEVLIVHRIPPAGARLRRPGRPGHPVRLKEATRQAFDALRSERVRAATRVIPGAMGRLHTVVAELREVAGYGYEAAIAEMSEGRDPEKVNPVTMVMNGLSRAAEKVEVARCTLFDAFDKARKRVAVEVADGMAHLIQRATTDRLTGRYLDARAQVAVEASRSRQRWRNRLAELAHRGSALSVSFRRRLWPVKRALGIRRDRSRAELRGWSQVAEEAAAGKVPVLYRRLFSLEPLTDPRLLAGRDDMLAAVERAWRRWTTDHRGALMVIPPAGAGVTSFLNIVALRLGAEAPRAVRRILRERPRDEPALAGRLAGWLGLGDVLDSDMHDLDALGRQVLNARPDSLPRLFILEGSEHLHMRVAGGSKLFERLLSFTRHTSPRIFWVLSMASSAWQLAHRRSPACVGDIERIVLDELTADELRHAILARHRLSGLPLRYKEPRTGRELLRRGAPGLRGSQRHQQLLESDYFQRLHRAALGSIRAALFYWLRSVDFRSIEGSLLVRPLETLPSLMGVLDSEQGFALKALLDHGTLTVSEYCEVARSSPRESLHLFRALQALHVIKPVSQQPSDAAGSPDPGVRYRIRPLMTGVVTAHLRSLNILH